MVEIPNGEASPLIGLTGFQRDALAAIATVSGGSGQDVLGFLTRFYGHVNHGRLYPNLDALVEKGLVEKGKIDRRTNSYTITDEGRELLRSNAEFQLDCL